VPRNIRRHCRPLRLGGKSYREGRLEEEARTGKTHHSRYDGAGRRNVKSIFSLSGKLSGLGKSRGTGNMTLSAGRERDEKDWPNSSLTRKKKGKQDHINLKARSYRRVAFRGRRSGVGERLCKRMNTWQRGIRGTPYHTRTLLPIDRNITGVEEQEKNAV